MQSILFGMVLLLFVEYGTSNIQFHGVANDAGPLPFQDHIENAFEAYKKGDIEQMEKHFKVLESVDPYKMNLFDSTNTTTDYINERINYVVNMNLTELKQNKIIKTTIFF